MKDVDPADVRAYARRATERDRDDDLAHHIALKHAIDHAAGAFIARTGR